MIPKEIVIRVDATDPPMVGPGDSIGAGQKVCSPSSEATCPISGTIRAIHFDRETHEFVIVVASV